MAEWVALIQTQIGPLLDFEGEFAARMVNNLDWTAPMSAIDFLRDIGKHFRVNTMVKKDAVSARMNSDVGISYTEFSYQILQGMDFLELYRRYGCTLQSGGSDQWGNLTAGTDLIHRVEGKSVHLLATPLITDAAGNKIGKSTGGGGIWLNPAMTSPYAFYQYFLNVEDALVGDVAADADVRRAGRDPGSGEGDRGTAGGPVRTTATRRRGHHAGAWRP